MTYHPLLGIWSSKLAATQREDFDQCAIVCNSSMHQCRQLLPYMNVISGMYNMSIYILNIHRANRIAANAYWWISLEALNGGWQEVSWTPSARVMSSFFLDLLIYSLKPNQSCQKSQILDHPFKRLLVHHKSNHLAFLCCDRYLDKLRSCASWSSWFCEVPGPMVWIVENTST